MFWNVQMKNGQIASIKTTDSDVWCLSVSGPHLLAAIGTKLDIYDLRNLKIPVQSKDFSKKYQIWCVCSFSSCQGNLAMYLLLFLSRSTCFTFYTQERGGVVHIMFLVNKISLTNLILCSWSLIFLQHVLFDIISGIFI